MTTSLVVLGENAARINVKVNPNMTILKVLELACAKMNIDSNSYDLKYHNKVLDLTSLIRFTNIANNAQLELAPITKSRLNSTVGVWLQIEDGSRFSSEFPATENLWEIIQTLLKDKSSSYDSPAIVYTRMEIIGKEQLQQKTLKDLGLVSGKALLRLLNKKESEVQAHVYVPTERKPKVEEPLGQLSHKKKITEAHLSAESGKTVSTKNDNQNEPMDVELNPDKAKKTDPVDMSTDKNLDDQTKVIDCKKKHTISDEDLNNFKNSISYLDDRNTLLFDIMDGTSVIYQDEGDDFYEPTVKDVNLVLRDLKNARAQVEDGQLCTSAMRVLEKTQNQLNLLHKYKKCIIRIHFPNRLVLQSIFKTTETVLDIINFIRNYLVDETLDFNLFTTPPKTILKPEENLLECGCVPSAMIHFSCDTEINNYLKPDLKNKIVTGCQASIAAFLVRKERMASFSNNESINNQQPRLSQKKDGNSSIQSTSTSSKKLPKWFKPL